jgi:predicted nucleic acid-binding protein
MSGKSVLVDTNILIYLLRGDQTAGKLLEEKSIVISFVSEIELISYKNLSSREFSAIDELLKWKKFRW